MSQLCKAWMTPRVWGVERITFDTPYVIPWKAFRNIALKYHPDKNPHKVDEATIEFRQFVEARDYLLDNDVDPVDRFQKEWEARQEQWEAELIRRRKEREAEDIILEEAWEAIREWDIYCGTATVNDTVDDIIKKYHNNHNNSSIPTGTDHPMDSNANNTIDIEDIKKEIEHSLQKLKEFNVDTDEYLSNLMEDTA
eukprot:510769_1